MQSASQKFGLIIPKKSKVAIGKSVFKQGDSEEEDQTGFNLSDQSKSKTFVKKQTQLNIEGALSQDANIFDYDASFEDDKKRREEQAELKFKQVCQSTKPKYMGALLRQAEERKKERLVRGERKVAKERKQEEEEGLFQDKERFETEAYKESRMKMQEEQREREEALQEADSGDLSGFYKHLFDQKMKSGKEVEDESIKKNDRSSVKEEKKDTERAESAPKKARIENDNRRDNEVKKEDGKNIEKRRDERGVEKYTKNKREDGKDTKNKMGMDNDTKKKTNKDKEQHSKVLPTKRTADVEDAKARYLARKNKAV